MFMTAEVYNAIKEWMEFPVLFGKEITGESFKEIKDTGQVWWISFNHEAPSSMVTHLKSS
jgi:hypothetical protein